MSIPFFSKKVSAFFNRSFSIHYFFLFTLLSILTLVMIFIGIMNYWQAYRESDRIFDTELIKSASVLNTIIENRLSIDTYHDDFIFQIFDDRAQKIILKSPDAPLFPLTLKKSGFDNSLIENVPFRVYAFDNHEHHFRIILAMKKDYSLHFQANLFFHDFQILVVIYLLLSLLIFLIVRRGLQRLNGTVQEISKRSGIHLTPINVQTAPPEIRPLLQEINHLFSRVSESLAREKRFTGDAAHELRTPLAALKTLVEIAQKETDEKKRAEIFEKIILGSNRCSHVIDQLLTLSRLEPEAHNTQTFENINLTELIHELSSEMTEKAFAKGLELDFSLPEEPVFLKGKSVALQILIQNLVNNSINYTESGGHIYLTLSTEKKDERSFVRLIVRDTGPGVPEELHERIFDRFFRQLGNKQPGSGLGLSIVTQVIKLHRGTIQAKTPENGKGLEMIVELPQDLPERP